MTERARIAFLRSGETCWYAASDAGAPSTWKVSKCPFDLDPTLEQSWGNGVEVGTEDAPIVNLTVDGDWPIVEKTDGTWRYDRREREFVHD